MIPPIPSLLEQFGERGISLVNKNKFVSLRTRLIIVLCSALLMAAAVFAIINESGRFLVWRYYLSADVKQERVNAYVDDFQQYVWENKLYVEDSEMISKWGEGKYVDIIVYKDESLMYAPNWFNDFGQISDGKSSNPFFNNPWISGNRGIEQYLTEEAKINYFKQLDDILEGNRELYPVIFVDGTLLVTVVDYTEDVLYVAVTLFALITAAFALALVMALYLTTMTGRINKLAQKVKQVEGGNLDIPIELDGNDEITALAEDVNSMRNSVVDNMTKERQAWEANTALITAMSHDIRTPLTVILGYLDLIDLQNEDSANSEYIAACKENTMRLKTMSDDMFSYFLVFGNQDAAFENASMQSIEVIKHMISEYTILLSENGYSFDISYEDEACSVCVDTMYLGRVIGNVFSNIEKYADPTEQIKITMETFEGGVDISFVNKIKMYDSKPESNCIGIKTCKKIMQKMGGSFENVESEDRFTAKLRLPADFSSYAEDEN